MEDTKLITNICGATGLNPNKIKSFMNRFSDASDKNNCRYDLIYSWVKQGAINFKQMKCLVKNIKIRNLSDWKKANGQYLFKGDTNKVFVEDYTNLGE